MSKQWNQMKDHWDPHGNLLDFSIPLHSNAIHNVVFQCNPWSCSPMQITLLRSIVEDPMALHCIAFALHSRALHSLALHPLQCKLWHDSPLHQTPMEIIDNHWDSIENQSQSIGNNGKSMENLEIDKKTHGIQWKTIAIEWSVQHWAHIKPFSVSACVCVSVYMLCLCVSVSVSVCVSTWTLTTVYMNSTFFYGCPEQNQCSEQILEKSMLSVKMYECP